MYAAPSPENRPMGSSVSSLTLPHTAAPLLPEQTWLQFVQGHVERALCEVLHLPDEVGLDVRWNRTLEQVREYVLRPAKRVRPALVMAGYCLAKGRMVVPPGLWRFSAGLELLHTFLLIHDDVADQASLRRGGPALHHLLAPGRQGEDLAVVVGDHMFALALEAMLGADLPGCSRVSQYYLGVCRHTAAGQYLDLEVSRTPLPEVNLFQTLRVAHLKTARYGFCAPLACGAMLAGASEDMVEVLERVGRQVGLAYQLRDDLIGLFGDSRVAGKAADGDFAQGKRTFPVVAAWVRGSPEARKELEALWDLPPEAKDQAALARARSLIESCGGRAATERAVERATRAARRGLASLPDPVGVRDLLDSLIASLVNRAA